MTEYPRYEREFGSYYFLDEPLFREKKRIVFMTDQVAFAFDTSMGEGTATLRKHGDVLTVEEWAKVERKRFLEIGDDYGREKAEGLRVLTLPSDFDVAEINRVVQNSTYLTVLLRRIWPEILLPATKALPGDAER